MHAGSRRLLAALAAACVLLLSACDDGTAEPAASPTADRLEQDCSAAVDALLDTTQRYLDSIAGTSPSGAGTTPSPQPEGAAPDEQQLTDAFSNVRAYAQQLGCDADRFREDITAGLQALRAGGPVADAVLLQLRAGDPPTAPLAPGQDLAAAVAAAPDDGVVELGPGEHVLPETLVLLRGVTLQGAGRDATTLTSRGASGTVLVLTAAPVRLERMTLTRPADAPGDVVSGSPGATLALTGARVAGARATAEGEGGVAVLMAAGAAGQTGPGRRTSLTVSDTEVVDNATAGIVVGGEHRADVRGLTAVRSGQCGVCFLATSDGTLADSRFEDNDAGVVVAGSARPRLTGLVVTGGDVGVQALDTAAPQVDAARVARASRAAFLFAGSSGGSVRGSTCESVPFGVVVGPQAAPEVDGNTGCELARGQ